MAQRDTGGDNAPEVVPPSSLEHSYQPKPHVALLDDDSKGIPTGQEVKTQRQRRANIIWAISMVIVIITAAVGGGVGGSLAVQNVRNSCKASQTTCLSQNTRPSNTGASSTTLAAASATGSYTADATNFVLPLAPTAISSLSTPSLPCPTGQSVGTYNSTAAFKTYCHESYSGTNMAALIAYSLTDCQDACLSYNEIQGQDICIAVSMAMNLGEWILSNVEHGNCYLKTAPLSALSTYDAIWTAVLCKDQFCNTWYS